MRGLRNTRNERRIYSKRYYKLANSAIVNEVVVVEGDRYDLDGRGDEALYLVCRSGKPIIALFRPALLLIYFITDD